jgi:CRP-like cAMP-binding protein
MTYPSAVPQRSVHNWILARLPGAEYRRLAPHLETVSLTIGEVLYRPDKPIRYVYFPETAVISQLSTLQDGSTAEVGVIGREGMLGIRLLFGTETAPHQATVQVTGGAVRVKKEVLEEEVRLSGPLHALLLGYAQALLVQVRQSAVCNAHHSVRQRLARWLLMMSDQAESNELQLTHEIIADMMGTRRATVTGALGKFRKAGLLNHKRGHITILDRKGLKEASCECYGMVKKEYDRLFDHEL